MSARSSEGSDARSCTPCWGRSPRPFPMATRCRARGDASWRSAQRFLRGLQTPGCRKRASESALDVLRDLGADIRESSGRRRGQQLGHMDDHPGRSQRLPRPCSAPGPRTIQLRPARTWRSAVPAPSDYVQAQRVRSVLRSRVQSCSPASTRSSPQPADHAPAHRSDQRRGWRKVKADQSCLHPPGGPFDLTGLAGDLRPCGFSGPTACPSVCRSRRRHSPKTPCCASAAAYESATEWHARHPALIRNGNSVIFDSHAWTKCPPSAGWTPPAT